MSGHASPWAKPMRPAQMAIFCALIMAAVSVVDLLTANINLAILYAIPVIIAAQSGRRRFVAFIAVLAVVLTYAGYFIGPRAEPGTTFADLLANYRLLNRSLCAVALLVVMVMALFYIGVHARLGGLRAELCDRDADPAVHAEVLQFLECLTALGASALLVVWVAASDFVAPREFNLSILYIVPLASMTWVRNRRLLWTMFAILLICTFAGYLLSFPLRAEDRVFAPVLLRNRFLAALALFGCTTLLHFAMARRGDGTSEHRAAAPSAAPPMATPPPNSILN